MLKIIIINNNSIMSWLRSARRKDSRSSMVLLVWSHKSNEYGPSPLHRSRYDCVDKMQLHKFFYQQHFRIDITSMRLWIGGIVVAISSVNSWRQNIQPVCVVQNSLGSLSAQGGLSNGIIVITLRKCHVRAKRNDVLWGAGVWSRELLGLTPLTLTSSTSKSSRARQRTYSTVPSGWM